MNDKELIGKVHSSMYQQLNLKPSYCVYKRWAVKKKNGQGGKHVIKLKFSKSGSDDIEKWYVWILKE